jgi:hypothetical protein
MEDAMTDAEFLTELHKQIGDILDMCNQDDGRVRISANVWRALQALNDAAYEARFASERAAKRRGGGARQFIRCGRCHRHRAGRSALC